MVKITQPKKVLKKINIKLTLPELQAVAIATAEHWMKVKNDKPFKTLDGKILPDYPKCWKKLSEYLFAIYRLQGDKK